MTNNKQLKTLDLTRVPDEETIDILLEEVKKRYPGIYKVLIGDRNKILAKNLYNLKEKYNNKKILAILGAGHKKGVEKILSDGLK